jgi:hypothetical protein
MNTEHVLPKYFGHYLQTEKFLNSLSSREGLINPWDPEHQTGFKSFMYFADADEKKEPDYASMKPPVAKEDQCKWN